MVEDQLELLRFRFNRHRGPLLQLLARDEGRLVEIRSEVEHERLAQVEPRQKVDPHVGGFPAVLVPVPDRVPLECERIPVAERSAQHDVEFFRLVGLLRRLGQTRRDPGRPGIGTLDLVLQRDLHVALHIHGLITPHVQLDPVFARDQHDRFLALLLHDRGLREVRREAEREWFFRHVPPPSVHRDDHAGFLQIILARLVRDRVPLEDETAVLPDVPVDGDRELAVFVGFRHGFRFRPLRGAAFDGRGDPDMVPADGRIGVVDPDREGVLAGIEFHAVPPESLHHLRMFEIRDEVELERLVGILPGDAVDREIGRVFPRNMMIGDQILLEHERPAHVDVARQLDPHLAVFIRDRVKGLRGPGIVACGRIARQGLPLHALDFPVGAGHALTQRFELRLRHFGRLLERFDQRRKFRARLLFAFECRGRRSFLRTIGRRRLRSLPRRVDRDMIDADGRVGVVDHQRERLRAGGQLHAVPTLFLHDRGPLEIRRESELERLLQVVPRLAVD